jgi:copper chaperone CopZ
LIIWRRISSQGKDRADHDFNHFCIVKSLEHSIFAKIDQIMTHTYNITGMKCDGCVAAVKSGLEKVADIAKADVQLESPQATITMEKEIPTNILQAAIGNYKITEIIEQ